MSAPPSRAIPPRWLLAASLAGVALALVAGCGGGEPAEEQIPDEASFCWLALRYEPVDQAPLWVLRRLDQLAPGEVDRAVSVLRAAGERLGELEEGDPQAIALEFEIRFDPDFISARVAVEQYLAAECAVERGGSAGEGL